ncbi:serine hydrolase [Paenibacillus sp. 22594]|uniref:serine hydrolase n=1 Tax=Paenibacillus sp. 22594 TaxID=3453947 RepID=UPI003F838142
MNQNRKRIRRMCSCLTAVLMLSFAGEAGAATQQSQPDSPASVQQNALSGRNSKGDYTGGPQDPKEVKAFLDAFFARDAVKGKAGNAAVSIVQGSKVLLSKNYGISAPALKPEEAGMKDTFRIGSISKVFTAAAIMQLVDQGKLSLQDNIEKYLDGYKVTNPFDTPVTIENLLTHTTGFEVREPSDASYLTDPSQQPVSLKESIFDVFPPVIRKPGTAYMYDNFASRLQGYIVQQVSGEPFGSYMQKHLFGPLGMNSSSFGMTKDLTRRLVPSYDESGSPIPVYGFSPSEWPEGSMLSSASDMALFMTAFLNGGRAANGTVILSPESVKAMSAYQMAIHPDLPDTTYGFESPVIPSKTNGELVISKGGDILGYSSLLWLLPDRKTGVFVSYNTNQDLRNDLFTAFMDHYYAKGEPTYETKGGKSQSVDTLAKFAGLYSDLRIKLMTRVEVTGNGTLKVSDVFGSHTLQQVDDLLFLDGEGNPLAFQMDADGRITYMKYTNLYSYAAKIPVQLSTFPDVSADHPYAGYILSLKSLGFLTDDLTQPFQPLQSVSRGAFIHAFNAMWSIPGSSNPDLFKDTEHSEYRKDIQAAVEAGMLTGTGNGLFEPDRPILREEAAAICYRLLTVTGIRVPDSAVVLAPGTSKWAVDAVRSVVAWKLHGPEVTEVDGVFDYGSQRAINKQELAALMFTMLLP